MAEAVVNELFVNFIGNDIDTVLDGERRDLFQRIPIIGLSRGFEGLFRMSALVFFVMACARFFADSLKPSSGVVSTMTGIASFRKRLIRYDTQ